MYKKGDFIILKSWEEITRGDQFLKEVYGFSKDVWQHLKNIEHNVTDVLSSYINFELATVYVIYDKKRNCWCYIPEKFVETGYSLSKEEAIKRHRMMWEWMSEQSLEQKKVVTKKDAFEHFGWDTNNVAHMCWCCEYAMQRNTKKQITQDTVCINCPLEWPNERCSTGIDSGYYDIWIDDKNKNDYEMASLMALKISKLYENMDI